MRAAGLVLAALAFAAASAVADGSPADAVAAGEALFNRNCTVCHGKAGRGGRSRPLAGRSFEDEYLFNTISKGRKRGSLIMPPWEKTLSGEQRRQLVAYIQSLGASPP